MRRRKVAIVLIEEQAAAVEAPILHIWYEQLMENTDVVLDEISRFIGAPVHLPETLVPSWRGER